MRVLLAAMLLVALGCRADVSLGGPDPTDGGSEGSAMDAPSNAVCGNQPSVVATGMGSISSIAVTGGYVYVASRSANNVVRVPVTGGPLETIASAPSPAAIAAGPDQLVIGGGVQGTPGTGALVSVPLAGGITSTLLIGLDFPSSVATADGVAFASDTGGASVKLIRVPLVGSSVDAGSPVSASPTAAGAGIAVTSSFVFLGDGVGGLQRFPELGAPPVAITGGVPKTLGVAAAGQLVAWISGSSTDGASDGVVLTVDPGGTKVTTVASGQKVPVAVATDGTDVFWSTKGTMGNNDATLARSTGTLAAGPYGSFGSLALDATCIYWSDANGNVLRMAR